MTRAARSRSFPGAPPWAALLLLVLAACATPAPRLLAGDSPEKGIGGTGGRPTPETLGRTPSSVPTTPALTRQSPPAAPPPPAPPPVSTAIQGPPPAVPPPVPAAPLPPPGTAGAPHP
jgi:hypothetical protein